MPTGLIYWVLVSIIGVVGFALIGYVHVHLADGKRFGEQAPARKKVIVALAIAQWPYLFLAGYGLMEVVKCFI
jgi:hypothetical protein